MNETYAYCDSRSRLSRAWRNRRIVLLGFWLPAFVALLFGAAFGASSAQAQDSQQASFAAAILKSGYTEKYLPGDEKWRCEEAITNWDELLSRKKINHWIITDKDLENGSLEGVSVLIMPLALCLSEDEKSSIRTLLDNAGGVVSTGAVGSRNEKGNYLGWDFLEELAGAKVADTVGERDGLWIVLGGNSPLTIGIDPGCRLELYTWQQVALVKGTRDAYWSDWSMNPLMITEDPYSDVAIAHGTKGNGRTVCYGFNVTEMIDDTVGLAVLKRVFVNSVKWAGRQPLAHVWYWPDNHHAAAVFTQDVEDQFANAQRSVDVLRSEGIPGTFFCVTELALKHPALVREFAEIGELGTHTNDHQICEGQPYELQHERLGRSIEDLTGICSGACIRSFRPPEELMDESTFKAWADLGGRYIFGEAGLAQQAPGTFEVALNSPEGSKKEVPIVVIPRLVSDDYQTIIADGLEDNDKIIAIHISDLNRVYKLSGLYMFAYHSQWYSAPEHIEVLSSMAKYAKTLDLWFATVGQVAEWWLKRLNMSADVSWATYRSLKLKVQNSNVEPVGKASITVYLPGAPDGVEIVSDSPDNPSPDYLLEGEKLVLFTGVLEPSSTRTYTITLQ